MGRETTVKIQRRTAHLLGGLGDLRGLRSRKAQALALHRNFKTFLAGTTQTRPMFRTLSWLKVFRRELETFTALVGTHLPREPALQRNGEAICMALRELPAHTVFHHWWPLLSVGTPQSCQSSITGWETLFLIFLLGTVPFLPRFNCRC